METTYSSLLDKVKNDTASNTEWETLAAAGKLEDLPPYFLLRCPEHLRPGYLQDEPRDHHHLLTEGLSGLPAYIPANYGEDDNSTNNVEIHQHDLADALVLAASINKNEQEDNDAVAQLRHFQHSRTIQETLVLGVGNRPSPFQLQDTISTLNVDVVGFAVRPRAMTTYIKGVRRIGGTFVATPQPLATSDVDYDIESEFDGEEAVDEVPSRIPRPKVVASNYFGGQAITIIEEPECPEGIVNTSSKDSHDTANLQTLVPNHLICSICKEDLSMFWDKNFHIPKEDLIRHYEVCWKQRFRTPPNSSDANTAQYMGTKNLCIISKAEAIKVPSRVPNPTHCASCNKTLIETNIVDAVVHKVNCFQAYCVQQEAWMCPICHQSIAGLEYDEDDKEYQRLRHVDCCNGIRIRNEQMAEKHLQLYNMAQGVIQHIDWATNGYRERYGKKPESRGDRMREIKDRFLLEKNKFPAGRSKLRNEILSSGEISTHAFGRCSQIKVLENFGLFQRSQFAITHEELARKIIMAIDNDETQRKLKYNFLAEAEQKHTVIKQMQLDGEKKVTEANRKWLADFRKEQRLAAVKKEEDEQLAETLEVDEEQLDFGDGNSELSFIDPAELKAVNNGDRSSSSERDSGSDGEEQLSSRATTPEITPVTILAKPLSQEAEVVGNGTAADWASEVQETFNTLTPWAFVVEDTPVQTNSTTPDLLLPGKQDIPKNLLPTKAEARKQRLAAKKAEQNEYELKYTLFWGEQLPVTWTECQDPADKRLGITQSLEEPSSDLVAQQIADQEVVKSDEVSKPETNACIGEDLETLPEHKKLASTLKHKRRNSRVKAQRKLERAAEKTEKKALVCLSRRQRMLEHSQAKATELAHLASKVEEVGKFKLLPLRVQIYSLARIVVDVEDEEPSMAAPATVEDDFDIRPLEVSAELSFGEEAPPRADSGTDMSSYLNEEDTFMAVENAEFSKPRGKIADVAFIDRHIVSPVWRSPLHIMAQNVQHVTSLDRMRARALDLFAGDEE